MQKMRLKDKDGCLTTYALYEDGKYYIGQKLKKLPNGVTNRKEITWREYSKIVKLYWKYVFEMVIEGREFKLWYGLGKLRVVKTLCVNYNPYYFVFRKTKDGVKSEKVKADIERYNGYFYFVLYISTVYKRYKIFPSKKIRKAYMNNVNDGMDYLDITK